MPTLADAIAAGLAIGDENPWPRRAVDFDHWRALVEELAAGRWTLLGLWGDQDAVHLALLDEAPREVAVVTHRCASGVFPSVGRLHPPAIRFERSIKDLFGLEPIGSPDLRPWLDHGRWGLRAPLGARPELASAALEYAFLPAEGEGVHQIPVGPVHAGVIEPGHFRFSVNGEAVVRLEERLGYAHKGVERLMMGADLERAARLAGRVSGDSTVAYALVFSRAVEAALAVEVPPRAIWLRALMAELERLANHFGDIGAICNDVAFALMHAHCGALRERVLRVAASCFGHRLMMDRVAPGGVSVDLAPEGVKRIRDLVGTARRAFPPLVELYDNTASLQDRTVGAGLAEPALVRRFGCGGYVGRASGRRFDARRDLAYPPYDGLRFEIPTLEEGDVNARVWIRIREVEQSLALVEQILDGLPDGPVRAPVAAGRGEGMAVVEGFRGDILAYLRLDADARIERCHLRDPSWFQWPVLEAAIGGNIVADFPLCNKSFNCSYSGHDL
ncbi:NADH-quinone oxidoreductase subunit C [Methylocapsa acidiphila]|uniref:hydrogenase large subunit n=1 Tax=Methylocapsa acidiphila TaxID=133552 RepID=UPI0004245E7F|nr:NADH-quinone oxidoreductase subunit C [Methylocapsa acidiphila]